MKRDGPACGELQETARRLTARLLPIYESRDRTDREFAAVKNDVLKKLRDHDATLTLGELIHATNASSQEQVAAVEELIGRERREHRQRPAAYAKQRRVGRRTLVGNPVHVDRTEMRRAELTARYLDGWRADVCKAVRRKKSDNRAKVERYLLMRRSFSAFVRRVEDRRRRLARTRTSVESRTHALRERLKDRTYDSVALENQVLTLMDKIKTPEACYTLLTWLSPAEWKRQFGADRLTNYELARSDVDLTRDSHAHYSNHLHGRTLDGYLRDVRLEPVAEMYWQSAGQFARALERLEKKTTDRIMLFNMIEWHASRSEREEDPKKHEANAKFRGNSRSAGHEPFIRFGYIGAYGRDEEYFRILKTMADICRQLEHPRVDFRTPLKMFEFIVGHLDRVAHERNKIPNDQWERTDRILQLIDKRRDEMSKSKSLRCAAVQQTIRHEACGVYGGPANRTRTIVSNRSTVPKQSPPKKPKKPTLNREQRMYLKCFTYLSPEDVYDDPTVTVPEFAFGQEEEGKYTVLVHGVL